MYYTIVIVYNSKKTIQQLGIVYPYLVRNKLLYSVCLSHGFQAHRGQHQGVHSFPRSVLLVHSNAPKAAFMNRRPELPTSLMSSLMPRLKNLAASPTCATAQTHSGRCLMCGSASAAASGLRLLHVRVAAARLDRRCQVQRAVRHVLERRPL